MKASNISNKTTYFAYGSNLSETQMKKRCPESKLMGKAKLYKWTPCFPQIGATRQYMGVMGIRYTNNTHDFTEGLIYELTEKDIKLLDDLEGVKSGSYKKTNVLLHTPSGEVNGFVYENLKDKGFNYRPSYGYLTTILSGLLKENFSHSYMLRLLKIALEGKKPSFKVKFKKFLKTRKLFNNKTKEFPDISL